ncbi:hypothetical protein DHB64_05290 [Antarcticibacterium sp. W02-3]|nr:hypothetical protein [Antarcticibacterium sp. W02-3]
MILLTAYTGKGKFGLYIGRLAGGAGLGQLAGVVGVESRDKNQETRWESCQLSVIGCEFEKEESGERIVWTQAI